MVSQLPNEILTAIFTSIRESDGINALSPVLVVSKAWNRIAVGVLWSIVVLDEHTLIPFVRSCLVNPHFRSSTAGCIRSMTLYGAIPMTKMKRVHEKRGNTKDNSINPPIQVATEGSEKHPGHSNKHLKYMRIPDALKELFLLLPTFEGMHTFSLFMPRKTVGIPSNVPFLESNIGLRGGDHATLLDSLPQACVNVEVHAPDEAQNSRDYLCGALQRLLPRLHNLRLHIHAICGQFLTLGSPFEDNKGHIDAPHLRSLVINTVTPRSVCTLRENRSLVHNAECGHRYKTFPRPIRILISTIIASRLAGSFPKMRVLKVIRSSVVYNCLVAENENGYSTTVPMALLAYGPQAKYHPKWGVKYEEITLSSLRPEWREALEDVWWLEPPSYSARLPPNSVLGREFIVQEPVYSHTEER